MSEEQSEVGSTLPAPQPEKGSALAVSSAVATKPEKTAYEKLPNSRLRRLVDALVAGRKGADAGRYAGSMAQKPEEWVCRMCKRPDVQAARAEREALAAKEAGRNSAYVLEVVVETIERCRQNVAPLLDRRGNQVLVENREGQLVPAFVFDAKAVLKGSELLGNYHKMWAQKHEHSGPNGGPIETANKTLTINTDDPVEASRLYQEMVQAK